MKSYGMFALCVLLLFIFGCSTGQGTFRQGYDFNQVDKVAVIEVVGGGGEAVKNQVSDFFVMELLAKGYAPIERVQVQSLLKEQRFQMTDITSAEGIAKAGEILNVPVVLIVNIPRLDEEVNLTAKMVDVEDGSVLWMGSGSGRKGRTLATITGAVGGAIAGAVIAGENSKTAGGVAGGVLGGVTGQALTPQSAVVVQEIIQKMCGTLPMRSSVKSSK